ncbi:flagellar export protein FliJ [Oceanotoga sp. DSM 15011]|uniref:flagellar export protein FliJ n=1 Tax=Oceanotoga sp. DSM 15011 TaxID=2984951 RepID=UPI0021F4A48D|nr:flagellar export protein FliJ [Oceanotoga sp. DSM 15011]UYP00510.1 flagellar export protein FliJ [Oceanotoga sp. DSM 15011]
MKFNFNLQRILDLKEKFENIEKENLSKKINERMQVENSISNLDKKINDYGLYFDNELKNSLSSTKVQELIKYRHFLKQKRIELIKQYQKKLREEEKARKKFLEAKKEKDIIEKLKFRKYEEYLAQEKILEAKEIDEIAQKMYINREKD